jgi:hypothetical protein
MKTKESKKETKNVVDEFRKDGVTRHQALCKLYNTLSNDDLISLINMGTERFFIWNHIDKTCYDLEFCCPNGPQIQINLVED